MSGNDCFDAVFGPKMQKALNAVYNSNGGSQQLFRQLVNMLSNLMGLAAYSALIASLSPWLVGLIWHYSEVERTSLNFSDVREFPT